MMAKMTEIKEQLFSQAEQNIEAAQLVRRRITIVKDLSLRYVLQSLLMLLGLKSTFPQMSPTKHPL